jgi:hypothetical protein
VLPLHGFSHPLHRARRVASSGGARHLGNYQTGGTLAEPAKDAKEVLMFDDGSTLRIGSTLEPEQEEALVVF